MSDTSINASAKSPMTSPSFTRASSALGYVLFPEPTILRQPFPSNQNGSMAGAPRHLSTGNTPYPNRSTDLNVPIELNIPLGQLSPELVCNAITTTNLNPPMLHTIIDALIETLNSCHQCYQQQVCIQTQEHKATINKLEEDLKYAQSHLLNYQETFIKVPEGYIENTRLPIFTIPVHVPTLVNFITVLLGV